MGLADPQRRWTIHVSEDGQWAKDEFHYNPSGKPDRWERVEVVPAVVADRLAGALREVQEYLNDSPVRHPADVHEAVREALSSPADSQERR